MLLSAAPRESLTQLCQSCSTAPILAPSNPRPCRLNSTKGLQAPAIHGSRRPSNLALNETVHELPRRPHRPAQAPPSIGPAPTSSMTAWCWLVAPQNSRTAHSPFEPCRARVGDPRLGLQDSDRRLLRAKRWLRSKPKADIHRCVRRSGPLVAPTLFAKWIPQRGTFMATYCVASITDAG